jgi:50S ribosomal subunit-associated GTPase HflX
VVAAKTDLPHGRGAMEELRAAAAVEVVATSALTGEGVPALKTTLWEIVESYDHSRA